MAALAVGIAEARGADDIARCRELFLEYQRGLGVSLCFQGFDRELANLPADYAPPRGRLLLAMANGEAVGCVAIRPLAGGEAEMKRLFVRPGAQAAGVGRRLAQAAIEAARELGYDTLRLDTLPQMRAAQALYVSLGFRETAPYNDNPVDGVRFMALGLHGRDASA